MPEAVRLRSAETRKRGIMAYARDKVRNTRVILSRALAPKAIPDAAPHLTEAGRETMEILAGKGLVAKTLGARLALHGMMMREIHRIDSIPHLETEIGISVLPRLFSSLKVDVARFAGDKYDLTVTQPDNSQSFMLRSFGDNLNTETSALIKKAIEGTGVAESEARDKVGMAFMAKGALCGFAVLSGKITPEDLAVANLVKDLVGSAFDNAMRFGKLHEEVITDELTGIYNRRYFDGQLKVEAMRAGRKEGSKVSMLMIDIDKFKDVNDKYGHQAGDEVLKAVGQRITASVRAIDHVCRYGGEEIGVILPDTSLEGAIKLAEKIRAAIACDKVGDKIDVAVSIGVANLPYHIGDVKQGEEHDAVFKLVKTADEALYEAKKRGRNQVRVYVNGEWLLAEAALKALESSRTSREAEVNRELADGEHNTQVVTGEKGSKGSSPDGQKP